MAMTPYSGDTSVIGKLGTTPQERGLTTQQFKDKFDEAFKSFIEDYFNTTHIGEINAHLADNVVHGITSNVTIYVDGSTGSDTTGEGTSANPYATIQKAINSAPRMARGNYSVTINIAPGTYNENVQISYFSCLVTLTSSGNVTIKRLGVYNSVVYISCNLTINTDAQFAIDIEMGGFVRFQGTTLTITRSTPMSDSVGIYVDNGGVFQTSIVSGSLNISNFVYAIGVNATGRVYAFSITGENNTVGLRAYGGIITYNTIATGLATTLHSTSRGGRIYTGEQAQVRNIILSDQDANPDLMQNGDIWIKYTDEE